MEENKNNNNGSVGGYVSKYSTDHSVSSQGAGIPVYEKYKGKEAHASKEYEITGGEKVAERRVLFPKEEQRVRESCEKAVNLLK